MRGGEPLTKRYWFRDGLRIPHVRGGEPNQMNEIEATKGVFPTCVGVNRVWQVVAGDCLEYSPRAWG